MEVNTLGYQESYIYAKEESEFESLLKQAVALKEIWDEKWSIQVSGILIIKERLKIQLDYNDYCEFASGTRLIHIVGERAGQRSLDRLFGSDLKIAAKLIYAEYLHHPSVDGKVNLNKKSEILFDYTRPRGSLLMWDLILYNLRPHQ